MPGGYNDNFECVDVVADGAKVMTCPFTRKTHSNDFELNYENPLKRTTVRVPNNGYVVVRFKADNPGLWFFHCHLFSHMRKGQAMIFDITDQGIAPVPPNMPTCPIQGPEKADPDKLIDLKSIGAPEAEIVVTDFRSGAGVIALSLYFLVIMMM